MVALLRGINVGGKGTLPMADVRAIATELGYTDVATYIQSGNLVLSTTARATAVARDLAAAIAAGSSVAPAVLVRTHRQLAKIVRDSPFLARGEDPAHLHVTFLDGPAAGVARLDRPDYAPEEVFAIGKELHLLLPNGMGRSRLAADLARRTGSVGTTRSWRTVTKLLEMADQAAG
jgi:uncharacterized protein (DUF1697 family)